MEDLGVTVELVLMVPMDLMVQAALMVQTALMVQMALMVQTALMAPMAKEAHPVNLRVVRSHIQKLSSLGEVTAVMDKAVD